MGGYNRFWEVPELIRVSSPCYFKIEPGSTQEQIAKPYSDQDFCAYLAREKVRYAEIMQGIVEEYYPEAKISEKGVEKSIPKV